jgi:pimeloyl-ACP methyl ester carboxylesterase
VLTIASVIGLTAVGVVLACVSLGPPSTDGAFTSGREPVARRFALAAGGALGGAELGDESGPLVLFVHGSPGSWRDWSFVLRDQRLAGRARLVAVDRLGWGGSAASGLVPSLAAQAAALSEVLRSYPAHLPAIVVGHSLGGPVAARLALDSPELVRALVLVAAALDPALEETTWYQALGRTWLVRPIVPAALARADDEIRPLRAELEAMLPLWARLTLPVFVLHGEDDALVPIANADFVERVLVNAPLSIRRIEDQGHLIPWERPELVAETIGHVLAEHEPPPGSGGQVGCGFVSELRAQDH